MCVDACRVAMRQILFHPSVYNVYRARDMERVFAYILNLADYLSTDEEK
jgi:hypothetical protein